MKNILIKLATYILKKYDITPIIDYPFTNPKLKCGDDIYVINKLSITKEYGCVQVLDISCHRIMEDFQNAK